MRGLRPTRRAWALAGIAAFCLGLTAGGPVMPPCEHEDSAGPCFWDANVQGNQQGNSFWIDADQTVHYTD